LPVRPEFVRANRPGVLLSRNRCIHATYTSFIFKKHIDERVFDQGKAPIVAAWKQKVSFAGLELSHNSQMPI